MATQILPKLRSFLWAISLVFLTQSMVFSQVTQVTFMKVKGDVNEYLEVEREWKKVHQKRLDEDKIYAWYLLGKNAYL